MLPLDKMKRKSALSIVIAVVFLASLMMAIGTLDAFAVEVVGSETGLRATVSGILAPTDNLAPGDTETSFMTISLDSSSGVQESSLPVWIKSEIIGAAPGMGGGNLDDKLELTVTHQNGTQLYKGSVSGFRNAVSIGNIPKGGSVDITFTVHLPGAATGNEYQAASMKVKWIVITRYTPPPSPTPTETPTYTPTQPPTQSPTPSPTQSPSPTPIVSTPTPEILAPPNDESSTVIEIDEEIVPTGLPKTGEIPPILFYGLGAGVVYIGIRLNKKKR